MIVGKIAQILDETLIIINVGAHEGVKPGMRFVVFEEGDPVVDPDSGEALGRIEMVKGIVQIAHVQDRISQATGAPEPKSEGGSILSEKMVRESIEFGAAGRGSRMAVARDQMQGRRSPTEPMRVGDGVRQLLDA